MCWSLTSKITETATTYSTNIKNLVGYRVVAFDPGIFELKFKLIIYNILFKIHNKI